MKLIATTRFTYAGKNLRAGDEFEAKDKDAKLLKAIGRAKDAYFRRDMRADLNVLPVPSPEYVVVTDEPVHAFGSVDGAAYTAAADQPAKPKRKYKRKDMVAE